jgi:hypothetical protein
MRTRTLISLIAIAAAAIVFGQWAMVMTGDDFTLHAPTNHKIFTYGFPFSVIECAPELPIHTPSWQIPFCFAGNFGVFLFVGLLSMWTVRRIREKTHHHRVSNGVG